MSSVLVRNVFGMSECMLLDMDIDVQFICFDFALFHISVVLCLRGVKLICLSSRNCKCIKTMKKMIVVSKTYSLLQSFVKKMKLKMLQMPKSSVLSLLIT